MGNGLKSTNASEEAHPINQLNRKRWPEKPPSKIIFLPNHHQGTEVSWPYAQLFYHDILCTTFFLSLSMMRTSPRIEIIVLVIDIQIDRQNEYCHTRIKSMADKPQFFQKTKTFFSLEEKFYSTIHRKVSIEAKMLNYFFVFLYFLFLLNVDCKCNYVTLMESFFLLFCF